MNELVKYKNEVNFIRFTTFNALDYDLFFALCNRFVEQGSLEVGFTYNELKERMNLDKNMTNKEFGDLVVRMAKKLASVNFDIITKGQRLIGGFFLFRFPEKEPDMVYISTNKWALPFLNDLQKSFTLFELEEFTGLRSQYSKTLYRLLKQYRTTGLYKVSVDELKSLLDAPIKYNNMRFNEFVLKPAVEDLQSVFQGLSVTPIRDLHKRGRPLWGYEFTFQAEKTKQLTEEQQLVIEDKKSDKQNFKPKKSKRNAFVDNIQKSSVNYNEIARKKIEERMRTTGIF